MVGIGLRVHSNSEIFYSVILESPAGLVYQAVSSLLIPKALEKPEQLNYARNTLLDIFYEYKVSRAGIRVSEYTGQAASGTSIDRYYLEGIIQESVASSPIEKYVVGQISTLTAVLQIPRDDFKRYADGTITYPGLPQSINWAALKLEQRESILTCHCGLKL